MDYRINSFADYLLKEITSELYALFPDHQSDILGMNWYLCGELADLLYFRVSREQAYTHIMQRIEGIVFATQNNESAKDLLDYLSDLVDTLEKVKPELRL